MGNDLGGNAKTLFSIDNGINNTGAMSGYSAADLLVQDTSRIEATSSDTSLNGAKIWITSDGKVAYDTSTLSAAFETQLNALQAGQYLTDSFIYAIRLGNGTLSWATATIQFGGANDAPTIVAGSTTAIGSISELADTNGSAVQDQVSGSIAFKDPDLIDTHTVTQSGPTFTLSSGSLTPGQQTALSAASSLSLIKADSTGTGTGSVGWTYKVTDGTLDFLAAGQTLTVKYNVTIDDGHGGTVLQPVTVTITGTNDAPVITAQDLIGAVTEQVDAGRQPHRQRHHHASPTSTSPTCIWCRPPAPRSARALGSLTAVKDSDTTGTGTGGQLTWTYTVADSAVEYLAEGQTKVESFTITLDDQTAA